MTPQERNAAILLNHSRIRPEFVQHNGRTIADLERMVDRRMAPKRVVDEMARQVYRGMQDPRRSLRLECQQDRSLELGICCYEERFGDNCSIQCQEPAVVHERLTEFETCLKHFGKVGQ